MHFFVYTKIREMYRNGSDNRYDYHKKSNRTEGTIPCPIIVLNLSIKHILFSAVNLYMTSVFVLHNMYLLRDILYQLLSVADHSDKLVC